MNVLLVFGTRPEAIKMIPVYHALQAHPDKYNVKVCVTAQHREMLDQVLETFGVAPDFDLDLMKAGQGLHDITTKVLVGLAPILGEGKFDLVLVHGDTTTTAAATLAAFYARTAVGHVEAGLRTFDNYSPFPEEVNRRITSVIAELHFVPTETARQNLLRENIADHKIFVTGNTAIDTLHLAKQHLHLNGGRRGRRLLVTAHRRENFGRGITNICEALLILASRYPDVEIVYPVHPNPNIRVPVTERLSTVPNIQLIAPLGYFDFVRNMYEATLVLSDSGGVQEEAPTFGKPVLVLRDTTERPEAVAAGTAKLVGTECNRIVHSVVELLENRDAYRAMAQARNPYGDGTAAIQIESAIRGWAGNLSVGA